MPDHNFKGTDTFTYTVVRSRLRRSHCDGDGASVHVISPAAAAAAAAHGQAEGLLDGRHHRHRLPVRSGPQLRQRQHHRRHPHRTHTQSPRLLGRQRAPDTSSPSATPRSSAAHPPSHPENASPASPPPPPARATGSSPTAASVVEPRRRQVLRRRPQARPQRPRRRIRRHPDRQGLLHGRHRRRHLHLRRRPLPRLHGKRPPQPTRQRHSSRPPPTAATGSSHPTAASSPSATPTSTAPWAAPTSTNPSSAWSATATATSWSPPTAASSPSPTSPSSDHSGAPPCLLRSSASPPAARRSSGGGDACAQLDVGALLRRVDRARRGVGADVLGFHGRRTLPDDEARVRVDVQRGSGSVREPDADLVDAVGDRADQRPIDSRRRRSRSRRTCRSSSPRPWPGAGRSRTGRHARDRRRWSSSSRSRSWPAPRPGGRSNATRCSTFAVETFQAFVRNFPSAASFHTLAATVPLSESAIVVEVDDPAPFFELLLHAPSNATGKHTAATVHLVKCIDIKPKHRRGSAVVNRYFDRVGVLAVASPKRGIPDPQM